MKTIEIKSATKSLAEYVSELGRGILIVSSGHKPLAAVVSLERVDAESLALSMSREFAGLIAQSRAEFERGETVSLEEMQRRTLPGKNGDVGRVAERRAAYGERRKRAPRSA